ncbi:MAG: FMN-binding protein [Microgenomates group bacterium]|jgi:uncharacterized protein with FMN-binding domain
MKGFLLSALIVIVFVAYAFMQKFGAGTQLPFFNSEQEDSVKTQTIIPTPSVATNTSTSSPAPITSANKYKDGNFTGDVIDANYGNVQVKATIVDGKIAEVTFLDYPKDRTTSQKINNKAMPILISEAITTQSATVDAVTGATFTSAAFVKSLQSALNKAV